ncbi:MAG TPA: hypothetical protein VEG28_00475 [Dehalococcoidia bacterium]|nr:hypothetical protein [Dehalococcoidia bacterium]
MRHVLRIALVLAIVAGLTVVGTGAIMAQTPSPQLMVKGIISAIDETVTPPTLTITPREGANVTLKVDSNTIITMAGVCNATIDDLATNDRAVATYDNNTMIASYILASPPLEAYRSFVGIIQSKSDDSFNVTTKKGDVTITVNCATKYQVPGVSNATFDNFNVLDKVAVLAIEVTGGSGVENLALYVRLIPAEPIYVLRVGTVESYAAGSNITIQNRNGGISTFIVTGDTRIIFLLGATDVTVGEQVIVIAQRDPATDQFTAKIIIVLGSRKR